MNLSKTAARWGLFLAILTTVGSIGIVGCGERTLSFRSSSENNLGGSSAGSSSETSTVADGGEQSNITASTCSGDTCAQLACDACGVEGCSGCSNSWFFCEEWASECTPCTTSDDCTAFHRCDPKVGRCQSACQRDSDCPDYRPFCNKEKGTCFECSDRSDCRDHEKCVLGYCVDCPDLCSY